MKKLFALVICFSIFSVGNISASTEAGPGKGIMLKKPVESPEAKQLVDRLYEIKGMDHKTMTKAERKVLREEVRDIKKELKATHGGVYISVGGIIIILLLLILIL